MAISDNPPMAAETGGAALVKIGQPTEEICVLFPLSEAAAERLEPGITAAGFVSRLCDAELHIDAIRFLAHALPPREAVWWACLAARETLDGDDDPQRRALEAAEAWVYHPDEEHRREAMTAGAAAANDAPARWAAQGAAWSGGSLAPPDAPVVPPGKTLTAQAVAGAVLLAAVKSAPEDAPERHRQSIAQAVDIARGGTGRQNRM